MIPVSRSLTGRPYVPPVAARGFARRIELVTAALCTTALSLSTSAVRRRREIPPPVRADEPRWEDEIEGTVR